MSRIEDLVKRADELDQRARRCFDEAHAISERFAHGQPIILRHHSTWTWYMVSSGPDCQPTGMALHPDEAPDPTRVPRYEVIRVCWPSGWDDLSVYVEAADYTQARERAATLFSAAWREVDTP